MDSIKLLYVEDNADFVYLLQAAIRAEKTDLPFDVHHVETLSECLSCLLSERFDVVLLDWFLGRTTTGDVSVKAIREVNQDVPIIILTSHESHEAATRAAEAGADGYLIKGVVAVKNLVFTLHVAAMRRPRQNPQLVRALSEALALIEQTVETVEDIARLEGETNGIKEV